MSYKDDISNYIDQVLEGNFNAFTWIEEMHKDRAFNLAFRICCNREGMRTFKPCKLLN